MSSLAKKRSYGESSREQTADEEFPEEESDAMNPDQQQHNREQIKPDDSGDWQLVEGSSRKKKVQARRDHHLNMREEAQRRKEARKSQHNGASVDAKASDPKSTKPALKLSDFHKLNSSLRISDLQQLLLYCLADGVSPQWLSVRHHTAIRRAVVLMVPGLERGMFTGDVELSQRNEVRTTAPTGHELEVTSEIDKERASSGGADPRVLAPTSVQTSTISEPTLSTKSARNPDDYLPLRLDSLPVPESLSPFSAIFEHLFPIQAPGDPQGNRVHSPVAAILTAPIPKSANDKNEDRRQKGPKPPRVANDWKDQPTPITSFITSPEDLLESNYILHPASCDNDIDRATNEQRRSTTNANSANGWKDANITGNETLPKFDIQSSGLDAGRRVLAIDCEMVKITGVTSDADPEYCLARISIRDWNHKTILDELVKPPRTVVDYVTAYSGMTEAKLSGVTTTLENIQEKLLKLFTPDTVLVGHSLDSDLRAIKMTHPYIVDTTIVYPHPRGPPMKSALKWLAQKYLGREIQKHTGGQGHDSIEDADAPMDLVKEKCRHGPRWGTSDASGEPIFKRLGRQVKPGNSIPANGVLTAQDCRTGAVVDHGKPERTIGAAALVAIGCNADAGVVDGVKRCVRGDRDGHTIPGGGVDFTFARMRELEARRGWASDSTPNLIGLEGGSQAPSVLELTKSVSEMAGRIKEIYDSLPKCTLFIVYSGVGDPREMKRLTDMQKQFRKEYATKKWDQISVKWTDTEEQAMKQAVKDARSGIGFVTVT